MLDEVPPEAATSLGEAGRLLTVAGNSALAAGHADRATALLTRACQLLGSMRDHSSYPSALESLLAALVESGQARRAASLSTQVDVFECAGATAGQLVALRLQLARAASVAGSVTRGIAAIDDARSLLPACPDAASLVAALDVVEASLLVTDTASREKAANLARDALAGSRLSPEFGCQAWHVLGIVSRPADLAASTRCFRRVREMAHRHRLPFWRIRAQLELGIDGWLGTGAVNRLRLVRQAADRAGALALACAADSMIALDLIFRGEYDSASRLIDQRAAVAARAGLVESLRWFALARMVLAARCRGRADMKQAMREFNELGGDRSPLAALAAWLAATFRALLEEDAHRARLAIALSLTTPGPWPSGGPEAMGRLLGEQLSPAPASVGSEPPAWDRPIAGFARSVELGRAGQAPAATAAFNRAEEAAKDYGLVRFLGIRVTADVALRDGWGHPAAWLRRADEYFSSHQETDVAHACRRLLRLTGAPVPRRPASALVIPRELRELGVTVREYEVLQLLMAHTSNAEIAGQLHLSPRTVEKHVASLLMKTRQRDRRALGRFAAGLDHDPPVG